MNTERLYHVAVYGTLMTGCRNYRWAADALARESCLIKGTLYDTGCGFPAFVPGDTQWHDGELLLVTQETLNRMDRLEGYPHLYTRKTIKSYTATAGWQDAYVYVMNRLPDSAQVMTHSWVERKGTHELLMERMAKETEGVGNGDTKTMFIAKDNQNETHRNAL